MEEKNNEISTETTNSLATEDNSLEARMLRNEENMAREEKMTQEQSLFNLKDTKPSLQSTLDIVRNKAANIFQNQNAVDSFMDIMDATDEDWSKIDAMHLTQEAREFHANRLFKTMSKISEADKARNVKEQKLFNFTMKTEHGEGTFKMLDELARERLKATLGVDSEVFDSFSLKTKEKIYQNLRQEYENRMKEGSKVLNQEVKNPAVSNMLAALNEKLGK
jgi:hypothetical protein